MGLLELFTMEGRPKEIAYILSETLWKVARKKSHIFYPKHWINNAKTTQ